MSQYNKSYRIRTEVGKDKKVFVNLDRKYDILEIMSLKINQENAYKFHTSDYGVIAGRVLANAAFGIPNAKISVFIPIDRDDINHPIKSVLYPYSNTYTKNKDNIRYNLLPKEQINDCHTIIGTFPEKQYILDNDTVLEIYEKYFKFTTRTNNSGDYMLFGVPVGVQNIHVDIDLSDVGILSQKPRDMVYKGYDINQFENPNKFKHDVNLDSLPQVISQEQSVDVISFWGEDEGRGIGITRCDIEVQYKFEPTCVFMGSVVSDNTSNGFSRKCIANPNMGAMDELTTGSGTIEMIRKTPNNTVEEFQIQGTQLIDSDGVWCYQIPMNLDYMMTDEFGNMVPTNDPSKGIPTRARVRFRVSMQDFDNENINVFRGKMLIPNNPYTPDEVDYDFGTNTKEESYKDLFWNCVYSVKSYIPRIQKGYSWKSGKFSGFKRVNHNGSNNPIPYNNIRVRLPFMFKVMCIITKFLFKLSGWANRFIRFTASSHAGTTYSVLDGTLCDDSLENVCIIPGINVDKSHGSDRLSSVLGRTVVAFIQEIGGTITGINTGDSDTDFKPIKDTQSIDNENNLSITGTTDSKYKGYHVEVPYAKYVKSGNAKYNKNRHIKYDGILITNDIDYLIQCVEMNLAQEYKVIQFDFYNDWINGLVYIPRWFITVKKKKIFFNNNGNTVEGKIRACTDNETFNNIRIVQQCALYYNKNFQVQSKIGCGSDKTLRCHSIGSAIKGANILQDGGIVKIKKTIKDENVYYYKPIDVYEGKLVKLYSTDIILIGTLNSCDKWGIPNDLKEMVSSTYQMPTNLALTDSDIDGTSFSSNKEKGEGSFEGYNSDYLFGDDELTYWNKGGTYSKILKDPENGNYTELSGIDWGYYGPLQMDGVNESNKYIKLFKPGGHFLGMSCTNSETSIKTCINLSRICEYGVLMSQRQTPNILGDDGQFMHIATVPSGFISKDEITDNNFRQIFATLNYNRLKTVINPETGYPIYDFKYINPTNFGGDLSQQIKESYGNYNRKISDLVIEKDVNYLNDYGNLYSVKKSTVNETQILRTGEFKDDEYLRFRFGVDEFTEENIKQKFLFKYINDRYSFPIFDNSFYFYFGLHNGKTAIEKFKEQYYAVCEKKVDLIGKKETLAITNITTVNPGINRSTGIISIHFTKDKNIIKKLIKCDITITKPDGKIVKRDAYEVDGSEIITIEYCPAGDYLIKLYDTEKIYQIERKVTLTEPRITETTITPYSFLKDIKEMNPEDVFMAEYPEDRKNTYGGYISFNDIISFKNRNGENITVSGLKEPYYILRMFLLPREYDGKNGILINNEGNGQFQIIFLGDNIINFSGLLPIPVGSKIINTNISQNEELHIPVGVVGTYDISLLVSVNKDGDFSEYTGGTIIANSTIIQLEKPVNVENGIDFGIMYNGIPHNEIIKFENWWENADFWKGITIENVESFWKIKDNLYTKSLKDVHTVIIDADGGYTPYTPIIEIKNKEGETVSVPESIDSITGATYDFFDNFNTVHLKLRDSKGIIAPGDNDGKPFIFPVIYTPFFSEVGLFYFNQNNKLYLNGYLHNGRTWMPGSSFNVNKINGIELYNYKITPSNYDYMLVDSTISSYYSNAIDNASTIKNIYGLPNYNEGEIIKNTQDNMFYKWEDNSYKEYSKPVEIKTRRTEFNHELTSNYNINTLDNNTPFTLEIGMSETTTSSTYTDSVLINTNTSFYNFEFEPTIIDDINVLQIKNGNGGREKFDLFLILSKTGEQNNLSYLLSDNNKPILNDVQTCLRRVLKKDFYGKYSSDNELIFDNEKQYIVLDDKFKDAMNNDKGYYLIAVPKDDTIPEIGSSIFKSISVSKLMNYNSQIEFAPFGITCGTLRNFINGDLIIEDKLQLFISPKGCYEQTNDNINKVACAISIGPADEIENIPFIGEYVNISINGGLSYNCYKWKVDERYVNTFHNKIIELTLTNNFFSKEIKMETGNNNFKSYLIPFNDLNIDDSDSVLECKCTVYNKNKDSIEVIFDYITDIASPKHKIKIYNNEERL